VVYRLVERRGPDAQFQPGAIAMEPGAGAGADDDLLRIIDLLVGQLNDTLIHRQVQVVLSPEARQWILDKTCADRNYGARPLRRALQKYVEDPLSEALIQGGIQRPATLQIYVAGDGLAFRPVGEATPVVH